MIVKALALLAFQAVFVAGCATQPMSAKVENCCDGAACETDQKPVKLAVASADCPPCPQCPVPPNCPPCDECP